MTSISFRHRDLDVACGLSAADGAGRLARWRLLREGSGLGSEPIPGGARIWLRPGAHAAAAALAHEEAGCCQFLDLELASDGGLLRLDITSPAAGAAPLIALIAGLGPP